MARHNSRAHSPISLPVSLMHTSNIPAAHWVAGTCRLPQGGGMATGAAAFRLTVVDAGPPRRLPSPTEGRRRKTACECWHGPE